MQYLSLSALALCSLAVAQTQTIVSPTIAAATEGSTSNAFPWTSASPKRYSQIHSDVGGSPKMIQKIAGRMNGTATAYAGTRSLDVELYMGNSVPWNNCSFVIPNNYIGPRTLVTPRQVINMGPFTSGTPAPFAFAIPLTTPYFYVGAFSLLWEMVQYSNAANGAAPGTTDVETCSITTATVANIGTGCTVAGQTLPMTHQLGASDAAGTFNLGFYVDHAPANAPTVLYLGASNPNLSIPGFCGPLYTDLLVSLPLGLTDASGFLGSLVGTTTKIMGGPCTLMLPNTFPGAVIYTQAHSIDITSTSAFPVANSEGHSFTVPTPNTTRVAMLSRIYSTDTVTATNAHYFNSLAIGYGAVTEFTY